MWCQSDITNLIHCSEEQCTLIKKLIGEEKTFKELKKMIGCSSKMLENGNQTLKGMEENGKLAFEWMEE